MATYWEDPILDALIRLLKQGSLHVFAGAGVSCLAGFPSWGDLLARFADAYRALPNKDRDIENELPTLVKKCDTVIIEHLRALGIEGRKKYAEVLTDIFGQHVCDQVHEWLIELPFAGYITTNYDLCFEEACHRKNTKTELLDGRRFCYPRHAFEQAPRDVKDLTANGGPFLLHMHGCIEHNGKYDLDNIVLTGNQYTTFYYKPEMDHIYDTCFYGNVLVLGTSMTDPYFMQKLKEKRGPGTDTNIANRKTCYVVRPASEKSGSPHRRQR